MTPEQQRLAERHLDLAARAARNLYRRHHTAHLYCEPDDLQGEARVSLCRAVIRFDPARHDCFEAYAYQFITWELLRYARGQDPRVRSAREDFAALVRAREAGPDSTVEEIHDQAGLTATRAREAEDQYRQMVGAVSLDEPIPVLDGLAPSRREYTADPKAGRAVDDMIDRTVYEDAKRRLRPFDRDAWVLNRERGVSQEEIGEAAGTTQMNVSRAIHRAERVLRAALREAA